jgi:hypothetical protein
MVGASDDGWTDEQVIRALDLLEVAKRSWSAFSRLENQRRRAEKTDHPLPPPPPQGAAFAMWLDQYLQGDVAAEWLVAHLGECSQCGHRLIHHGGYACGACGADPDTAWEERCRVPLPP